MIGYQKKGKVNALIKIARDNLAKWATTLAVLFLLVQVACDLYLPTITSDLVNNGIVKQNLGYIWHAGGLMLIVAGIGVAAQQQRGMFILRLLNQCRLVKSFVNKCLVM